MKKSELRVAIQEMDTYQFGLKNELHNKLTKVTSYIPKKEAIDLINQLDEPDLTVEYRKGYEQGVLNAIQTANESKLVEIPQFVADWIEKNRDKTTLLDTKAMMIQRCINDDLIVLDWVDANDDLFTRAWLDGYTIEKEKMYRVKLPDVESESYNNLLGLRRTGDDRIVICKIKLSTFLHSDNVCFTEKEIKRNHEYLWQFAEEVSE